MKAAIVGGGKGCRAILEMLFQNRLSFLGLEVLCVVDPKDNAPGMAFARNQGIRTFRHLEDALTLPGLETVIELVGSDVFLEELYKSIPRGVRVIDHVVAQMFWELEGLTEKLQKELDEKRTLERKLREERNLLQNILDSLPDAVIVADCDMNLRWVNARLEELTGIRREDLTVTGKFVDPFCDRQLEQNGMPSACSLEEVLRTGKPVQYIHFDPVEGRKHNYYRIIVSPAFGEDGHIHHLVQTARPIDQQVAQTREIEESERRFRQFVENAHDMITIKDLEGIYLVINDPAASMFNMSPMDFIGRSDYDILPYDLADRLVRKDKETIALRMHSCHQERLSINGSTRFLNTVRFPIFNYKGDVTGVCSISRDVTEQQRLQEAVIHSEKMAVVGKMAASVAHEINNPLTGVLAFAEELRLDAMESDPLSPAVQDYDIIIREAKRCREIVSKLLDYARIEKPRRRYMSVNTVIRHALDMVEKQAAFHDIRFDVHLDASLPDAHIDPSQMQQVFLNLVINAAEAMDQEGAITIRTTLSPDFQWIKAGIRDQGAGIPEELQERVFEPFFSTKGAKGTGLGLSCIHNIVGRHGGRIELKSRSGEGTEFTVYLPVTRQSDRESAQ